MLCITRYSDSSGRVRDSDTQKNVYISASENVLSNKVNHSRAGIDVDHHFNEPVVLFTKILTISRKIFI